MASYASDIFCSGIIILWESKIINYYNLNSHLANVQIINKITPGKFCGKATVNNKSINIL